MSFRPRGKPSRLNHLLFRPDGRAKPVLSQIPPLIEELVRPLGIDVRTFLVGSQVKETFRTKEDAERLLALRKRGYQGMDTEEIEFVTRLFDISREWWEESVLQSIRDNLPAIMAGSTYLPSLTDLEQKIVFAEVSDADLFFMCRSIDELRALYRGIRDAYGSIEKLKIHMRTGLAEPLELPIEIMQSNDPQPGQPLFEIATNAWLEYQKERAVREMNMQQGVQEIVRLARDIEQRPILIAIYGFPNSGKSHLIDKLVEAFRAEGLSSIGYASTADITQYTYIRSRVIIDDVVMFHSGWHRNAEINRGSMALGLSVDSGEGQPDILAHVVLGRTVDLSIGIHNPDHRLARADQVTLAQGEYDLVVRNPDSVWYDDLKP